MSTYCAGQNDGARLLHRLEKIWRPFEGKGCPERNHRPGGGKTNQKVLSFNKFHSCSVDNFGPFPFEVDRSNFDWTLATTWCKWRTGRISRVPRWLRVHIKHELLSYLLIFISWVYLQEASSRLWMRQAKFPDASFCHRRTRISYR
jgi:hypothetical protein